MDDPNFEAAQTYIGKASKPASVGSLYNSDSPNHKGQGKEKTHMEMLVCVFLFPCPF